MSSTGRMRLWAPLLLAGAMTLGTGFATPAAAHCNGHNGHGHNGCPGHNGHGHHNGRCLIGHNGHHHNGHHHHFNGHHHRFNGHHHFNGHGFVHWRAVREPVFGFRTRLVPVHNGFNGFNGFNGCRRFNGFSGFNGFNNVGFFD
jgi:hypothetical protein